MSLLIKLARRHFTPQLQIIHKDRVREALAGPTLFLSNHVSATESFRVALTLDKLLEEGGYPDNPRIRNVQADDIYLREFFETKKLSWILKNKLTLGIGKKFGTLIIKRSPSLNPNTYRSALWSYIEALKQGSHLIVYPMAGLSQDGCIDYVLGYPTLQPKHMKTLAKRVHNLGVQFIHYAEDPVLEQGVMTMGECLNPLASKTTLSFVDALRPLTAITPTQLFSLYTKQLFDYYQEPHVVIDKQDLQQDVDALIKTVGEHYPIMSFQDVDSFVDQLGSYLQKQGLAGVSETKLFIHRHHMQDQGYDAFFAKQSNALAHIDIDQQIRGIAMTRVPTLQTR